MLGYWQGRVTSPRGPEGDGAGGGGSGDGSGSGSGNGGNGNGGAATPPPWASEFGDDFKPEKAWETLQNLRRVERDLTKERNTLKGKVTEFETKDQTELEKATTKTSELEARIAAFEAKERTAGLRAQVAETARTAGAHNPDDVFALLDQSALEIDDAGKVKNATALINALKRDKAYLFARGGADAGAGRDRNGNGGQAGQGSDFNTGVRSMFGIRR